MNNNGGKKWFYRSLGRGLLTADLSMGAMEEFQASHPSFSLYPPPISPWLNRARILIPSRDQPFYDTGQSREGSEVDLKVKLPQTGPGANSRQTADK